MHIAKYPVKGRNSKEGVVVKWALNEGQSVKNEDLLLQIEAAGELIEIKCDVAGTLLRTFPIVGAVVRSGEPLAIIGQKGEDVSKALEALGQQKSAILPHASTVQTKPKVKYNIDTQAVELHSKKEETMAAAQSTGNADNVIPILMPQAGQSMEEGTILSWKIKEGQTIEVGQVIMEIETDKATMEVEATDAGRVVKIVAGEGEIIEVKKPVAFIADNDADVDAYIAGDISSTPEPAPTPLNPVATSSIAPAVSVPEGAVTPILMPQAGQSMEEGTILAWKVKEGDQIEVGQIIMEIETDKATMEVEAVDAGRIAKIVAAEGEIVEVKAPVAYLAEDGVDVDAYVAGADKTSATPAVVQSPSAPSPAKSASAVKKTAVSVSAAGRVKASPAARKIAADKGIDLTSIDSGSGPSGRILSSDVENADVVPTETQIHSLTKMRRAIANNLLYSKQNVPHFYAKTTIDATSLFSTYRKTKEQFKCTINDFVTHACAKAIRQYPEFRSQYKDTEIVENPSANIGIAVGTDDGLTVPVVVGADRMQLKQLANRTREVVESARNGKLEGMGQGVFTITNLGMFGVEEFSAIINPPESAILAVGAVREGVIVKDGGIRPGRLMTVTLSVDHRVIDGVVAAQFLKTLKELLEEPEKLVS